MPHADFVHLRVHTAYSLLEGAIPIGTLAALCRDQAMPAAAITDSNNLFGALEFSSALPKEGVQPIIGCTLNLEFAAARGERGALDPAPVVLLVKDETGYGNLLKLVSGAHLASDGKSPPHTDIGMLESHHAGLILLTGGAAGPLGTLVRAGREAEGEALFKRLHGIFGDRLYMEIQRHGMAEEEATEGVFLEWAYAEDVPLVATNEAYFPDREMFEAHDALICIAEGSYLAEEDRRQLTPEHYFKSPEEMRALFSDVPEAVDNTLVIARRTAFKVPEHDPILPRFAAGTGESEAEMLRRMAADGLETRLKTHVFTPEMDSKAREAAAKAYRERLAHELDIIENMGFPGYFLIVADFIQWAKANNVPVGPGRGSGAGSVVAWALLITDLDPLRFGLLFERFLNPERVSMPDFDIDFCQEKRDRVIHYVQEKYGHDQVAQIITFGKLQARAVMRDVGRVLQMPYGQVDRLCKMVPNNPANPTTLEDAIAGEPRLQEAQKSDDSVAQMLDVALKLEGLYRHASTHAAGVVIGDRPLDQLVPLYRDPRSDMPVTQFNMKWVEKAGLVKFDFLGLKTLTVINKACDLIAGSTGETIDISLLPLADAKTFEMLAAADTVGVFQLESSGMRDALRQLKPDSFEDIIAMVALYRPGPMDNIPVYIKRKHGEEAADYLHPKLEPVLEETHGVIIYQEQVMQIAQILAGYSLGEADLLRRAMGKKIAAEMDAQRQRFVEGAVAKGVDRSRAEFIFDLVAKFAGYGFNKSHAAAYALVAYQTAWLKANYPVEFFAASMTLDMGNTDKLNQFRQELERMDIPLLPPDANLSEAEFAVERLEDGRSGVRYALGALKNVGKGAMEALVAERQTNGPFTDVFDLAARLGSSILGKRALENLIRAGALDSLAGNRAQLLAGVEVVLRQAGEKSPDGGQVSLFGDDMVREQPALPEVADWNKLDRLAEEAAAIGFYLSGHPLDAYADFLKKQNVTASSEILDALLAGKTGLVAAGTITRVQERKSARGAPFAFVQLSDPSGSYEAAVFSEVLAASRNLLEVGRSVIVDLEGRVDGDAARLTVQRVRAIDDVVGRAAARMRIALRPGTDIGPIHQVLSQAGKGDGEVAFLVPLANGGEAEVVLGGGYAVTPMLEDVLRDNAAVTHVEIG